MSSGRNKLGEVMPTCQPDRREIPDSNQYEKPLIEASKIVSVTDFLGERYTSK